MRRVRSRVPARLPGGATRKPEGLEVVPVCPFIAHYIERRPECEELMASGYRDR